MEWIHFVILASFTWSITNVMDKFLIDKRVNEPVILAIFVRATTMIPLLFIILFFGFSFPAAEFLGFILLAGLLASAGAIIFYKAIHIEEISRTMPLFQFIPIFVLFLSFFLIGEVLGFFDYVGFIILVVGGLVISAKRLTRIFRVEKVFWLVMLSSFLYATSYVITKYVLLKAEYWNTFILLWAIQIVAITSLLGFRKNREHAKFYIKRMGMKDKAVIFINSVTSILAFVFAYFAINLGPVTLVQAAENMQLVFVFLLVLFFTRFFPDVLKEKFDRKTTSQKITGIILIITGVLLIQLL